MKGTRNGRTELPQNPLDILEDTPDSVGGVSLAWGDIDSSALAALLDAVSRAGGIVTLGLARTDGGLYCSVRFGDKKRAYVFTDAGQFPVVVKPLIDACKRMQLRALD